MSKRYQKWLHQPEKWFLIIGLFFGLFHLFAVPAFGEPDEGAHFNRAYQISEGHLFGEAMPGAGKGSYSPKAIIEFDNSTQRLFWYPATERTTFKALFTSLAQPGLTINNTADRKPLHIENAELHNPLIYTPQVAGIFIAKLLNFSVARTFYLVRLSGLIFWLIVCYYGLKRMKALGWAALVLLLTPPSLQIASSISADTTAVAITVLFVGMIMDKLATQRMFTRSQLWQLTGVTIALACVKFPYAILAALLVVLPSKLFAGGKRHRLIFLASVLTAATLIFGAWTIVARKGDFPYKTIATGLPFNETYQEKYLIHHPITFAHKLYTTYFVYNPNLVGSPYNYDIFIGYVGILGNLGYAIAGWAIALYFLLVGGVFTALVYGAKSIEFVSRRARLFIFCLLTLLFLLINASLFITWSPANLPYIDGLQSRYFIPVLIALILCLLPLRKKTIIISRTFLILVPLCLVLIHLSAAVSVYKHFYAPPPLSTAAK